MNISIIFSEIVVEELIYLILIEFIAFILYILYKEWLYKNKIDKIIHSTVKNYVERLNLNNEITLRKFKESEAVNEEIYDIIYGYIHDLKTPLAAIQLSEPSEVIKKEVFRLEEIIEKLLYLSRISDIRNDLLLREYSIDLLVKNIIKKYQTIFIEKKISLTLSIKNYEIITDQKWFEFALSQVLSNALKYTDPSGEIIITTDDSIKRKHLQIIDNGCGIPQGYIHRVFEKGFSFDHKNRYYKGTGIGLYLARKIFDYIGVECSVQSTINQGTRFTLYMNEVKDIYSLTEM